MQQMEIAADIAARALAGVDQELDRADEGIVGAQRDKRGRNRQPPKPQNPLPGLFNFKSEMHFAYTVDGSFPLKFKFVINNMNVLAQFKRETSIKGGVLCVVQFEK